MIQVKKSAIDYTEQKVQELFVMDMQFSNEDLNEIRSSTVYTYSGKKVKTHTRVVITATIFILLIVALLVVLTVTEKIDRSMMVMMFFIAFLLMAAYIVKILQFDAMKALTQYYVDSDRNCYKIKYTKVSTKIVRFKRYYSLIPLVGEVKTLIDAIEKLGEKEGYMEEAYQDAQSKALGYYYVTRFKRGLKDWNWLNGGEAKVVYLGKIDDVRIPAKFISKNISES